MPREHESPRESKQEERTDRQAHSGRNVPGKEQPHHAHNEHTEDHKGERRQSDSRR